jgi:hypothetical protein
MDEVKKILTESLVSRIPGILPFVDIIDGVATYVYPDVNMYNGNYGKIICDVVVNNIRMTYPELHSLYMKFKRESPVTLNDIELYDNIKDVFGIVSIPEFIMGDDVPDFLYLPELSEWRNWFNANYPFCSGGTTNLCSDCCICQEYINRGGNSMYEWLNNKWDELVINDEWMLSYKWKQNDKSLLIKPYKYEDKQGVERLDARINLNVQLTSLIDVMGIGTPIVEEWVAGKKYYQSWVYGSGDTIYESSKLGNGVLYNGEIYYLNDSKNWELTDDELKRYEYVHGVDVDNEDINNAPHYWFVGLYDKMYQELLFDKQDVDGNFIHWTKSIDNRVHDDLYYNNAETITISAVTQSQLSSFKRLKVSVDDNGVPLPGVYVDGEDSLQLPYLSGTAINVTIEVDENNNISNVTGDIINNIYVDPLDNDKIIFDYFIGANLEQVGDNFGKPSGGIRYKDVYGLITSSITATIDGNVKNLSYNILDTNNCEVLIENSDLNNASNKVIVADSVTFDSTPYSAVTDYSPYIRQEYLLGTVNTPVVESDVEVDRGTSAAFERHLKLGEVKTLEDMVVYGNGFFNIVDSEQS